MIGLPAADRRYYPLYAKCVELQVPLSIHTSANWTTVSPSDLGHPRHIDVVAADFPELRIVMSHAGYPWVLEACLLAWKYPNVYLELAAHRPRYLATAGTGWEPLLRFGQTTIRDKVLFGTGWFLLGRPPAQILDEFRAPSSCRGRAGAVARGQCPGTPGRQLEKTHESSNRVYHGLGGSEYQGEVRGRILSGVGPGLGPTSGYPASTDGCAAAHPGCVSPSVTEIQRHAWKRPLWGAAASSLLGLGRHA